MTYQSQSPPPASLRWVSGMSRSPVPIHVTCRSRFQPNMTIAGKSPFFNRRYILKWLGFYCHVSFPGCRWWRKTWPYDIQTPFVTYLWISCQLDLMSIPVGKLGWWVQWPTQRIGESRRSRIESPGGMSWVTNINHQIMEVSADIFYG